MDLGFGAFLEKFESYFGLRVTKGLCFLIGLAVVGLCGHIIYKHIVVTSTMIGASFISKLDQSFISAFFYGAIVGGGLSLGALLVRAAGTFWILKQIRRIQTMRFKQDEDLKRIRSMTDQVDELQTLALMMTIDLIKVLRDTGALNETDLATLEALMKKNQRPDAVLN